MEFSHFISPWLQWHRLPTFLVGEYLFYALSIIAFIHARKNGSLHLVIWVASFLVGTTNDIFFMYLPVVDNFWQAQATIMLTPRLPLYIPCVYNCFMYYAVVTAWQWQRHPLANASLAGILGLLFYGPYDVVGAKFLWWTWHDTDAPIRARILGVPIGSSMWILTFVFSFSLILYGCTRSVQNLSNNKIFKALLFSAIFTTPLMLILMTGFQFLNPQHLPSRLTLTATLVLYVSIILTAHFRSRKGKRSLIQFPQKYNGLLLIATLVYFLTLLLITVLGTPEQHISTGVHQTYGPCHVTGKDISGNIRDVYICKEDYHHDNFSFTCQAPSPRDYDRWYTICGKPYSDFLKWLYGMLCYTILGSCLYWAFLRYGRIKYV